MREKIKTKFKEVFGTEPVLFRAPGRINLIGEHTDYNDGFVLPAAIDKEVIFALLPNNKDIFRLYSYDMNEKVEIKINDIKPQEKSWANYLLGVADQIQQAGHQLQGIDCVFGGNIPIGAGLSSSAAIECGFGTGLNHLFKYNIDNFTMAKLAQKAEHIYAKVNCGIMDQFASMFGQNNHVMKLDCRTLEHTPYELDMSDFKIVLCDTNVKHSLAGSEYNQRRHECEKGIEVMKKYDNSITALRDVSLEMLNTHKNELNETVYKRCEYVINENIRVNKACEALENNNFEKFGELMYQSHEGLRDNYEVSCKELDILADIAKEHPAVLGARMMGGGFGGCTINLVKEAQMQNFIDKAKSLYKEKTNNNAEIYIVDIESGAGLID